MDIKLQGICFFVIPAQAGIHFYNQSKATGFRVKHGMTVLKWCWLWIPWQQAEVRRKNEMKARTVWVPQPLILSSSWGQPQALMWGSLFFGFFLLAKQKKETRLEVKKNIKLEMRYTNQIAYLRGLYAFLRTTFYNCFFMTSKIATVWTLILKLPMSTVPDYIFFYCFCTILVIANTKWAITIYIKNISLKISCTNNNPLTFFNFWSIHNKEP